MTRKDRFILVCKLFGIYCFIHSAPRLFSIFSGWSIIVWNYKRDGVAMAILSSTWYVEPLLYVLVGIILVFLGPGLYKVSYPADYGELDTYDESFLFGLKILGLYLTLSSIRGLLNSVSRLQPIISGIHNGAFAHLRPDVYWGIISSLSPILAGAYLLLRGRCLVRIGPRAILTVSQKFGNVGAISIKTLYTASDVITGNRFLAFVVVVICALGLFTTIYFTSPHWPGFAVVWVGLYISLLLAAGLVVHADVTRRTKTVAILLFFIYVLASAVWVLGFYKCISSTELSLLLTIAQIVLLLALTKKFWEIKQLSALLLIPALAWQAFEVYSGYARLGEFKYFSLKNVGIDNCAYSFGGYSVRTKNIIPGLDAMKGYARMSAVENFHFTYSEDELAALKETISDPCVAVRDAAFLKIGDWNNSKAVNLLVEIFNNVPALREKVLWRMPGYPMNQYARSDQKVKELVLKTAGPGNDENLRRWALLCIDTLNYAEGQEYLLAAMSDPSPLIRRSGADSVQYLAGLDDLSIVQRLREIYAASSDTSVKNSIAWAFKSTLFQKYPNIPLEIDKASGETVAVDTQKVPLQALSYPVEGSSTTVLFNIPAPSKTKGYIEFHFGRELSEVTPELKRQMEDELQFYTVKGDSYLVGIGGDQWIKGTLTDFRALSPACGGFVVGVLSVDSPDEQKLLSGVSSRELFVKKDTEGSSRLGLSEAGLGILKELPLTTTERKSVEAALKDYISGSYGEWKTKAYEEGMSRTGFDELRKLANYDVELKYKLVPVNMGKGSAGFIVTAGWGKDDECYATLFGYLQKNSDGYKLIKITERRGSPDATGEDQRVRFQDYPVIGTISNVVDYNRDGYGDIIYSVSGYESYGFVLGEFDGDTFKETQIGYGLGC